jgi:small membrane protein
MLQQLLALLIIIFFLSRLFWQKKKNEISVVEFIFWLCFWFLAMLAIIFIHSIDEFVASLGFSSSGINILFYIGTIILFYLILKLRLRLEKIERHVTKIVREIALVSKK